MTNLDQLIDFLEANIIDRCDDLPTFGGPTPADTLGIFSWDETRYLVQGSGGWELVLREEYDAD